MKDPVIENRSLITLYFALELENGDIIDSNFGGQPASFTLGDGNMLEGFENCLLGMGAGQENSFVLAPEQAFGQVNQQNIHSFPRSRFANIQELTVGLVLTFIDPGKAERPGIIHSLEQDMVVVDFNHPLAGKSIVFKVQILSVTNSGIPVTLVH